jgi:hypothetical protein
MQSLECRRAEEGVEPAGSPEIDPSALAGRWVTTNRQTTGIVEMIVEVRGGNLIVRTLGAGAPQPCDWGERVARVFSDGPASSTALAFSAEYDLGFIESHLQAKIKKGVLVVAGFNRVRDGSGRSNYFSREFFYRVENK